MSAKSYIDHIAEALQKAQIKAHQDAVDAWLESIGQKQPKPLEIIETRPGHCECGGDAVQAVYHADYCPKFE